MELLASHWWPFSRLVAFCILNAYNSQWTCSPAQKNITDSKALFMFEGHAHKAICHARENKVVRLVQRGESIYERFSEGWNRVGVFITKITVLYKTTCEYVFHLACLRKKIWNICHQKKSLLLQFLPVICSWLLEVKYVGTAWCWVQHVLFTHLLQAINKDV